MSNENTCTSSGVFMRGLKHPLARMPLGPRSPGTPVGPRSPGTPVRLRSPGTPVGPRSPGTPLGPRSPGTPLGPRSPGTPLRPRSPGTPLGPCSPGTPVGPRSPGMPVGPRSPGMPLGPRSPGLPFGLPPHHGGCNPNSINFDTLKTCFNTAGNSRTACKSVTTASSMDKKANAPVTLKGALAKGGREESKGIFPAVDPTPKPAGFRITQAHILPQKRGSSSGPTGVGGDKQMNVKPPPSRKKPPVTRQNVVGVQGKEPFRASAHSTAGCAQPKKKPLPVMRVRPMKPGRPPRVDLGQYRSRVAIVSVDNVLKDSYIYDDVGEDCIYDNDLSSVTVVHTLHDVYP
ncbi:cell wall adhesin EAP1 [Electrophorus electricus]|uniref:cell wall adhesin EAP1 n=1 Tax=Electrophorus electricus TaxID=8005 RepID=UPI0015CF905A|nr:cell wall adhesin EAP1 [Electrophorus electricus]